MFSTKHTKEAGQDYFQHLNFAFGLFKISFVGSMHFLLHGLTGGLYSAPEEYSLNKVVHRLSEQEQDLLKRKGY